MLFNFDNSYAALSEAFYVSAKPASVSSPTLIRFNRPLAEQLGLDADRLASDEGLAVFSGNQLPEGAAPLAQAYSGHQFGGFSPQLGDGRALLLGEVVTDGGDRYDIQLKGSGPTPFSRRGDGRSALGPVLREYIVSEAMAALGVPTTRALAAVSSGDNVLRERIVPGGVFTRVAQSHIRVGTFQWFAARQDNDNLKRLADYTIARHYPEARAEKEPYLALLRQVIERQARLIAHWMQFGFIHGVMNTDNMAISGETIDYGPCAFMDAYDPMKVFSSIDQQGRYAFSNQADMGQWNLARFAETLLPLIDERQEPAIEKATSALGLFHEVYQRELRSRFAAKIGIEHPREDDWQLIEALLDAMANGHADFSLAFRHLPSLLESACDEPFMELFDTKASITKWLADWRTRLSICDSAAAALLMRKFNPVYIPRNHRIEEAIQAGNEGDFAHFHRLVDLLREPYAEQDAMAEYEAAPKPDEVVQATFCGT